MTDIIITGTILDGIFLIIGQPTNFAGWIFAYCLAGFIFVLTLTVVGLLPIYFISRRLLG